MTDVTDGPLVVLGQICACEGDSHGQRTWRGQCGPMVVRVTHEAGGVYAWTVYVHGASPLGIVARGTGDELSKAEAAARVGVESLRDALARIAEYA